MDKNMRHKFGKQTAVILVGLAWISVQSLAQAQEALQDYLEMAMQNNPAVQSSFKQYEAALESVNQKGALPDPQFSAGVFLRPMELLMGNQRAEMSVMQMFPWFGMNKVQKDEAMLMAEMKFHAFREEKNRLAFQVKETYFQLLLLESQIDIANENRELLRAMEELALARFQGGDVSAAAGSLQNAMQSAAGESRTTARNDAMGMGTRQNAASTPMPNQGQQMNSMGAETGSGKLADVMRIQVQRIALENEIKQTSENLRALSIRFNQLVGRPYHSEVQLRFPDISATSMILNSPDGVWADNPMLNMLEKESQAFGAQAEMAKLEGRPMLGLGLNYMVFSPRPESGVIGGMDGMEYMPSGMGNNMVMPMLTMSLPIYRKKYKSMEREAELWRENAALQKQSVLQTLEAGFEAELVAFQNAQRTQLLLQDQVKMTRQIFEIQVTAYATGEGRMEDVLSIMRELVTYDQEFTNSMVESHLALARLEALIGI
jgi:outer membrane protein TolC